MSYNKELFKAYKINEDEIELRFEKDDFSDCIDIPDYVNGKRVTRLSGFGFNYDYRSTKVLKLGKFVEDFKVRIINSRGESYKLEKIYIPSSLTYIDKLFLGTETPKLRCFEIDENNPTYKVIENCLVDKKTKTLVCFLGNPYIPETEEIQNISRYALAKLPKTLKANIYIPKTIKHIDSGLLENANGNFTFSVSKDNEYYGCKNNYFYEKETKTLIRFNENIQEIDLENEDILHIGTKAFVYLDKIKKVKLPKNLTSIGKYAFRKCKGIKRINIPQSVNYLSKDTFKGCDNLERINLPRNLSFAIGFDLFANKKLKRVDYDNLVLNDDYIIVSKNNKLPIIVDEEMNYFVYEDREKDLVIPESVQELTISSENDSVLQNVIIKGMITSLEFEGVIIKNLIFENKNSCLDFKDGVVYFKDSNSAMYFFIDNNIEEYRLPDFLEEAKFKFSGGKSLKRIIIPKNIKKISTNFDVDRYKKFGPEIVVENPNIDFEDGIGEPTKINLVINESKSKNIIEVNENYFDKNTKTLLGRKNSSNTIVPLTSEDFDYYLKAYKEHQLDGLKNLKYVGFLNKKRDKYKIRSAFYHDELYIDSSLKDKLKQENGTLEFVDEKELFIQIPCKINTNCSAIIKDCYLNTDKEVKLFIPKNIKGLDESVLSDLASNTNIDVEIDKENKNLEIEDGVIIDKKTKSVMTIVGKYLLNESVHIKEGVTSFKPKIELINPKATIYIPSTVKEIKISNLTYKTKYMIDENNKYFYIKNERIYDRSTDLPLTN